MLSCVLCCPFSYLMVYTQHWRFLERSSWRKADTTCAEYDEPWKVTLTLSPCANFAVGMLSNFDCGVLPDCAAGTSSECAEGTLSDCTAGTSSDCAVGTLSDFAVDTLLLLFSFPAPALFLFPFEPSVGETIFDKKVSGRCFFAFESFFLEKKSTALLMLVNCSVVGATMK